MVRRLVCGVLGLLQHVAAGPELSRLRVEGEHLRSENARLAADCETFRRDLVAAGREKAEIVEHAMEERRFLKTTRPRA